MTNNRKPNPLDRHELTVIFENAEQRIVHLEGRLKVIIAKLIERQAEINDTSYESVQVTLDIKGETGNPRFGIKKLE